jgi:hypothetical protein
MDDFYDLPDPKDALHNVSREWHDVAQVYGGSLAIILLSLFFIAAATWLLSGSERSRSSDGVETLGMESYWLPYIGHGLSL